MAEYIPAENTALFFKNVSYVCQEPVLANARVLFGTKWRVSPRRHIQKSIWWPPNQVMQAIMYIYIASTIEIMND
jgi:hypothetical protein